MCDQYQNVMPRCSRIAHVTVILFLREMYIQGYLFKKKKHLRSLYLQLITSGFTGIQYYRSRCHLIQLQMCFSSSSIPKRVACKIPHMFLHFPNLLFTLLSYLDEKLYPRQLCTFNIKDGNVFRSCDRAHRRAATQSGPLYFPLHVHNGFLLPSLLLPSPLQFRYE